jgi:putative membrane protein insertion efficiency factor
MKYIALLLIKFYKAAISPYLPRCCRYYPSCSTYAYDAVKKYGFLRGSYMAARRILRCHPFHAGGYDPVPDPLHIHCKCSDEF